MSKKTKYISAFIFIILIFPITGSTKSRYRLHRDRKYNFRILIPKNWKRSYSKRSNKNILTLRKGSYTNITITASGTGSNNGSWNNWKRRYSGRGKRLRKIIETRETRVSKNVFFKLFLFEYTYKRKRNLKRVMIIKYYGDILTVECKIYNKILL